MSSSARSSLARTPTAWFVWLTLVAVAVGVYVRFAGAGSKVVWNDEASTLLWMSGHRYGEEMPDLFTGEPVYPPTLLRYQRLDPNRSILDTLYSGAASYPRQTPGYFLLVRCWAALAGDSPGAIRALSGLFSLAALAFAFLLGRELLNTTLGGCLLASLFAVSPFQVLYAQEARPYSLWTMLTLLSSWLLLQALKQPTRKRWLAYTLSVIAGMYTHLFFVLVVLAHGALARREARQYLRSLFWVALAFTPWVAVMAWQIRLLLAHNTWLREPMAVPDLAKQWIVSLGSVFVDLPEASMAVRRGLPGGELHLAYSLVVALGVALALYSFRSDVPRNVRWFVLILVFLPFLALALPDLVLGGMRSVVPRYLTSAFIGVQIAVAAALAGRLRQSARPWVWAGVTTLLIVAGGISSLMYTTRDFTWTKWDGPDLVRAAETIENAENPVIWGDHYCQSKHFGLSYLLTPEIPFVLVRNRTEPLIPNQAQTTFLICPRKSLPERYRTETDFLLEEVDGPARLWKLVRKPR